MFQFLECTYVWNRVFPCVSSVCSVAQGQQLRLLKAHLLRKQQQERHGT